MKKSTFISIILLVFIVLLSGCTNSKPDSKLDSKLNSTINIIMDAFVANDVDTFVANMSAYRNDTFQLIEDGYSREYCESVIRSTKEYISEELGNDFETEYTITKTQDEDIENVIEIIESYLAAFDKEKDFQSKVPIENYNIKKAVRIFVDTTNTANGKTHVEDVQFILVEENGTWKLAWFA